MRRSEDWNCRLDVIVWHDLIAGRSVVLMRLSLLRFVRSFAYAFVWGLYNTQGARRQNWAL